MAKFLNGGLFKEFQFPHAHDFFRKPMDFFAISTKIHEHEKNEIRQKVSERIRGFSQKSCQHAKMHQNVSPFIQLKLKFQHTQLSILTWDINKMLIFFFVLYHTPN